MGRSSKFIEETMVAMEESAETGSSKISDHLFQGFITKLEDYLERQVTRT